MGQVASDQKLVTKQSSDAEHGWLVHQALSDLPQDVIFEVVALVHRLRYWTEVSQVSAGWSHSLAVSATSKLWAWGSNEHGQLGVGNQEEMIPYPVLVSDLPGEVISVSGSYYHCVANTSRGVYAWGLNENGQLGTGDTESSSLPREVKQFGQVVSVATGLNHTLALTRIGRVYAWGSNTKGQLGIGLSVQPYAKTPTLVPDISCVKAIACGKNHSLAMTETAIYSWGSNAHNQLGQGLNMLPFCFSPEVLSLPNGEFPSMIAAGEYHSLAISETKVFRWGLDEKSRITFAPTEIATTDAPRTVQCGKSNSAILTDDQLFLWGSNTSGQLGHLPFPSVPALAYVAESDSVKHVAWGVNTSLS